MSLIDSARRQIGRARRRLHPNRVVFHHVPKCGGTSVGRAIRKRFLLSQATVLPDPTYNVEALLDPAADHGALMVRADELRERMFLYHLAAGVDCVSAHVRFSEPAWDTYRDQIKFVTILREPVARFISHYRWSHGRPEGHAHIPEDFPTFLESPMAEQLGAFYVSFFSGLPADADMTTVEALARAKANLDKFDVIGFLDRLDDFQSAFKREVGVRIRVGHENRATAKAVTMEPTLAAKIDAITGPDQALFAHALASQR
ncbi:MAG: sulfotransferase family 2 domain-containing protein [Alphaproteobacteria bacterium]|jgi:hypothetical protein